MAYAGGAGGRGGGGRSTGGPKTTYSRNTRVVEPGGPTGSSSRLGGGPGLEKGPLETQPIDRNFAITDFVEGVVVESQKLGYVGEGTIYVKPTINAIENGSLLPRNKGYMNKENHPQLKGKPPGYWQEYHMLEFGGGSPLRILRGRQGEYFLSPNHYQSIIPLNQ